MAFDIFNPDSIFDSRDVIERIEELKAEFTENTEGDDPDDCVMSEDDWAHGLGTDGAVEMVALLELAREGEDYAPDWQYGATFIADDEFTDYMKQTAEDCDMIDRDTVLSNYIDWDRFADDCKTDYTEVTVNGGTYWVR